MSTFTNGATRNLTNCARCCEPTFDLHLTRSGFCRACHTTYLGGKVADFLDWGMLTEQQAELWADLIADDERVLDRTADRHPIRPGAVLWDYDLRPCTVLSIGSLNPDHRSPMGAVIWWRTTTGVFDGSRLAYRHPSDGRTVIEMSSVPTCDEEALSWCGECGCCSEHCQKEAQA